MSGRFDVIVVGGGSAGCVLGSRLSEDPKRTVLVLEAGPDYGPYVDGRWPADILDADADADESHDWGFEATSATRAKILGGCSSHNECAVVWAPPGDYRWWAKLGDERWGFERQKPLLERAQTLLNSRSSRPQECGQLVEAFLGAIEEIGLTRLDDLNAPRSGASTLPMNVRNGVRWNTSFAYLDAARERPNLTIQAETLVDRITFAGSSVRSVLVERSGIKHELFARTVIVAAGSYMSPAILQRSGIGSREELERLEVDQVVGSPGVGVNLLDHPMVDATFSSRGSLEPTAGGFQEVLLKARSTWCSDEYWDTHVLMWVSPPDPTGPTQVVLSVGAVQSDSVGEIRLRSTDPHDLPIVRQPFSSLTDHDVAVLADGIGTIRRLIRTDALGRFVGDEQEPGLGHDLEDWIRASVGGYWHPVGTCRIGSSSDRFAVVDPIGRVYGTEGLIVADASIFPTTPRANTNLPTIGIAELIASTIL
jgi:choline dehydrogenase